MLWIFGPYPRAAGGLSQAQWCGFPGIVAPPARRKASSSTSAHIGMPSADDEDVNHPSLQAARRLQSDRPTIEVAMKNFISVLTAQGIGASEETAAGAAQAGLHEFVPPPCRGGCAQLNTWYVSRALRARLHDCPPDGGMPTFRRVPPAVSDFGMGAAHDQWSKDILSTARRSCTCAPVPVPVGSSMAYGSVKKQKRVEGQHF